MTTSIQEYFRINNAEQIQDFFHKKNDFFSQIVSQAHRLQHYIWKGVWVNEDMVYNWVDNSDHAAISPYLKDRSIYRKVLRCENKMTVPARSLCEKIQSACSFFLEFLQHPTVVGSILPSSGALAKAIVRPIPNDENCAPRMLLEVGPGTDGFTDRIIKRMNPEDTLHLVEYNEKFCNILTERYKHLPNVKVFHRSILDHEKTKYDYIISGLPLNTFESAMVDKVFQKFEELSAPDATLSYFEYPFIKKIAHTFSNTQEQSRLEEIDLLKKNFYEKHQDHTTDVVWNIPPARIRHHKMK